MDRSDRQPIPLRTFLPVKRSIAVAIGMVTCIALMDNVIMVVGGTLFTLWVWGLAFWAWRKMDRLEAELYSETIAQATDHEAEMRDLRARQLTEVSEELRRQSEELRRQIAVIRDVKVAPVDELGARRRRRQAPPG